MTQLGELPHLFIQGVCIITLVKNRMTKPRNGNNLRKILFKKTTGRRENAVKFQAVENAIFGLIGRDLPVIIIILHILHVVVIHLLHSS
ncbi:MAG: hypothetical protein GY820_44370 [Gammaproteobacteria bacterium]|nr:hypothetical protein [Gammaproteobacteria bacterium]